MKKNIEESDNKDHNHAIEESIDIKIWKTFQYTNFLDKNHFGSSSKDIGGFESVFLYRKPKIPEDDNQSPSLIHQSICRINGWIDRSHTQNQTLTH